MLPEHDRPAPEADACAFDDAVRAALLCVEARAALDGEERELDARRFDDEACA